eukprot:TRINITY_DN27701_c0_g2_i1.p1 TRINITY_DN27701_c0_g2~~TRINITY_DN27701_c0_g2_i1.p1  ORF type:complete len:1339 (-),score=282.29 TRINITY_DN27701_c0_g2_i1:26-4042(-)
MAPGLNSASLLAGRTGNSDGRRGVPPPLPAAKAGLEETRSSSKRRGGASKEPALALPGLGGSVSSVGAGSLQGSSREVSPMLPSRRVRVCDVNEASVGGVTQDASAGEKQRRMAVFFLDPAQLIADIQNCTPVKKDDDHSDEDDDDDEDDDEESKEASPDEVIEGEKTKSFVSQRTPTMVKRRAGKMQAGDNEFIQVAIRIRPFLDRNAGERTILSVDPAVNEITVQLKPDEVRKTSLKDSPSASTRDVPSNKVRQYKFDYVLDSRGSEGDANFASQDTVYETIGARVVRCAMEGYNACLFAYGQTGTGKTHTIMGNMAHSQQRGLLPRILEGLFTELEARKEEVAGGAVDRKTSLQISYLEIFNEQIHDLLVPPKVGAPRDTLQVRYHPIFGVMINDLTQSSVTKIEEAMELVEFGTRMRSIASTSMNSRSSRAHTVFTFRFEQTIKDGETSMAQVQLVDLAGREQEKSSSDNKDRLKERQFINTSLFHLSTCIMNLSARSKAKKVHEADFAFRNSRLTLLLAHSLSGNSRTGMIAAVSPASSDLDETISTLRFADHVKKIKTAVTCNKVNKADIVKQLQEQIKKLTEQLNTKDGSAGSVEQIAQLEAVCSHFKEAFQQEKSRSEALAAERAECLKEMGLSVKSEGVSVMVCEGKDAVPYLVNLSEDPYLQGCLMYFLKGPEEVTIGNSDGNRVRICGLGIWPKHCIIRNDGNRRLFLQPIPRAEGDKEAPRVFLNGRRVTHQVEMRHQDRLILGHACAFRVAIPLIASEMREAEAEGGSKRDTQGALDQALAEIEDSSSQSFQHLRKYVEDMEQNVGPEMARAFVKELHRAVPLVDEANQITQEVGQDANFELQVLTDLWSSQTNVPEMVVAVLGSRRIVPGQETKTAEAPTKAGLRTGRRASGLWQLPAELMPGKSELKFVWTLEKFRERLQSMRDIYEELGRNTRAVQQRLEAEPYNNPWKEIADAEVCMMLLNGSGSTGISQMSQMIRTESECVSRMSSKAKADDPLSEILKRSQELIEGASAVLQQPVRRQRSPTLESFYPANSDQEEGLEELEMQVAENMEKLSEWYNFGRRFSISAASAVTCPPDAFTGGASRSGESRPRSKPFEGHARGQHELASHGSIETEGSSSAQGSGEVWDPRCDSDEDDDDADEHHGGNKRDADADVRASCARIMHNTGDYDMADLLEMAVDLRKENQKLQKKVEELWWKEAEMLRTGNGNDTELPMTVVGSSAGPQPFSPSQRLQPRLMQQSPMAPPQSQTILLQQQLQIQMGLLQQQQQKFETHSQFLLEREQKLQTWSDQLSRKEQTLAEMQQVAMRLVSLQAKATGPVAA